MEERGVKYAGDGLVKFEFGFGVGVGEFGNSILGFSLVFGTGKGMYFAMEKQYLWRRIRDYILSSKSENKNTNLDWSASSCI